MSLPTLPGPNQRSSATHQNDYGFSKEQMQIYGQQCYEQALLDAMNATLPFGKTGAVIAAAIGVLK